MPKLPHSTSTGRQCRSTLAQALALVGVAMAAHQAHAQSNVTIYGIVDQGVSKANDGTTPGNMLNGRGTVDRTVIKAGNTSRLGFRLREDLGDSLYARMQIEHRFAMDTGMPSNANVFWLARSVVAVGSNSLGEFYAGREYSAAYWVPLVVDPTLWSYVSQTGAAYTYANYTPVPSSIEASNLRWSNSVGYKSPKLGPVTFEVAGSLGEGLRHASTSANVQFKQGPFWLGLAYDGLDSKTNLKIIGGSFDFGFVRPSASYSQAKGGVNGDAKSYTLSALVPTGFGRMLASFGSHSSKGSKLDSKMVGAGAQYDLSKRTLLYVNVGSAKQDTKTRTTAFDLGVKHTF